jgi:hypothetical protein
METGDLPAYETPVVITYTDEEILDALGAAQANVYDAINEDGRPI